MIFNAIEILIFVELFEFYLLRFSSEFRNYTFTHILHSFLYSCTRFIRINIHSLQIITIQACVGITWSRVLRENGKK